MSKLKVQLSKAMVYQLTFLTQDIKQILSDIEEALDQYPDLKQEPIILDLSMLSFLPKMDILKPQLETLELDILAVSTQDSLRTEIQKWGYHWIDHRNLSTYTRTTSGPSKTTETPAHKPTQQTVLPSQKPDWTEHVYAANKALRARKQGTTSAPIEETKPETEKITPINSVSSIKTMVHRGAIRSGQKVYAPQADLIVIGTVSAGAEIIADGHIHVYGPLRGRAIAGAHGDTKATIFTTHLNAELISIAGIYMTIETPLDVKYNKQSVLIELVDNQLKMSSDAELN